MKILSVVGSRIGEDAASWRMLNIMKYLQLKGNKVRMLQSAKSPEYFFFRHLELLRSSKYDIVYGNGHIGTFSSILGKIISIPLIFDMHGDVRLEYTLLNQESKHENRGTIPKSVVNYAVDFLDIHFANRILCVSMKMLDYLVKRGVPKQKLAYVPNGVDLQFFKPVDADFGKRRREEEGLDDMFVVGYLGGFQSWQGVDKLISASESESNKKTAFVIVGGNLEERKDNTLYFRRAPRHELVNYYALCDILVLPRPSHPATEVAGPTKLGEYAALGKPILTTDVGDASHLVNKYKCGIVVRNNDPDNLSSGISKLRETSKQEIELMGDNARRLAESEFDWVKISDNLNMVLQSAVND